ncbi:MAG: hypothetical protein M1839_002772 [Geoglossum umbratile]|nr:MAG: hypothetical protein M1839_002772 [Geoglossum umbratile]
MRTPEHVVDREKGRPGASSLPAPPKSPEKPLPPPLSSAGLSPSLPVQRAIEIFNRSSMASAQAIASITILSTAILSSVRPLIPTRSSPDIAAAAREISFDSSSDIEFGGISSDGQQYGHHSPDAAFRHNEAGYPSIVIETSFPQKRKDLARLADNYILGFYGNIGVVIGLDIEYCGSKRATVSVWESGMSLDEDRTLYLHAKKTVHNEIFRNDDSSPVSSGYLDLPFAKPSDLDNEIHPIFRFENFDIPHDQYKALALAFRLASLLITKEHCIDWWVSIYFGRHCTTRGNHQVVMNINPITKDLITATKNALLHLASNISFRFKVTPNPEYHIFGGQYRSRSGQQNVRLSPEFRKLIAEGSIPSASLSQQLRYFFFFAVNIVHEVAHAFYQSRPDICKNYQEPYFYPDMETGIFDHEIGSSWERSIFGGKIQPNLEGPDESKSVESCFYGLQRSKGPDDGNNFGAIPMHYICSMMSKSKWSMVKEGGLCELKCPTPTMYARNPVVWP